MSGVAGIMHIDNGRPAAAGDIQQMLSRMRHRARDGNSWRTEGSVALGHAWLDTTGEDGPGP
ncbi:hypothetical protein, partial [Mesorhizobium sp.]